jgi:hypothetical protein
MYIKQAKHYFFAFAVVREGLCNFVMKNPCKNFYQRFLVCSKCTCDTLIQYLHALIVSSCRSRNKQSKPLFCLCLTMNSCEMRIFRKYKYNVFCHPNTCDRHYFCLYKCTVFFGQCPIKLEVHRDKLTNDFCRHVILIIFCSSKDGPMMMRQF